MPPVEVHLVIPAVSSQETVDDLVARYRVLRPKRLLFTKVDEVSRAPELAAAPARTGIPVTWITNGQAVPEDIEEPTRARLLELSAQTTHSRAA
jgi:flagellar biosynthesis protein FlhF